MNIESKQITFGELCPNCGVPNYLHATSCGWANAGLILNPSTEQEKEWQSLQLEASGISIVNGLISLPHPPKPPMPFEAYMDGVKLESDEYVYNEEKNTVVIIKPRF